MPLVLQLEHPALLNFFPDLDLDYKSDPELKH